MNGLPSASSSPPNGPRRHPWYHWRRLGFNFLTISLIVHLLLGFGAAYLIVQTIQAKRKQTFAGPAQSPNAPTRAIEHQVQMQKKKQTMSAPAPIKRVTTISNTKIALPALPPMPRTDSAIVPLSMAGMGGTGTGLGFGGNGGGGGGGSGGGLSLFGLRDNHGGVLSGTFFDLKQTPDGQPTPIAKNGPNGWRTDEAANLYVKAVEQFVTGGMNDNSMASRYFKGPNTLYTSEIFIPVMNASEGPRAFNLEDRVQPSRWFVHYKGKVTAPESGTFHFVGVCDDVLIVKFNNQIVLDCGSTFPVGHEPAHYFMFEGVENVSNGGWWKGCGEGTAFNVQAGSQYPIDIIIGEWPGGEFKAYLQILRDGTNYAKDPHGNPIIPIFRTGTSQTPASGVAPVYQPDGPIWKAVSTATLGLPSL